MPHPSPKLPPWLLHEDDDLWVVSKPHGLLSVPGRGADKAECMQSWLQAWAQGDLAAFEQGKWPEVRVVHRLDQHTSGLMVFARHKAAQAALQRQFEHRSVRKTYVAQVQGVPARRSGVVDVPIGLHWPDRPKHCVDPAAQHGGKPAQTRYRVGWSASATAVQSACAMEGETPLQNAQVRATHRPDNPSETPPPHTWLVLQPLTGRTHQLRLHLADASGLACPIVGDLLYGGPQARHAPRMMLHAARLVFTHPSTGQRLRFVQGIDEQLVTTAIA